MPYRVLFAEDAERDIEDLFRFIAGRDGTETAERVLKEIETACADPKSSPPAETFRKSWRVSGSPNTGNCIISRGA
ncbi:toxin-antitoxin system toxin RelE/ParE family protein (plasmid) [Sinorhizobium fredii]|uniref:Toxin-antitoxin system toxin RelE/ParE family protein n=1 Tax=Rhizobium fredii TaxID=380 RepID=A0A2L0HCK9_RHIFR|nr:toxin-antitoxin system toxin RelE/ParE family protein [Sinorhizobium fredii]